MPRLDRYFLSQLLGHFGFFALILVGVYWVNRAIGLFDQLMGDGQSALVFLEFSLLSLPNVIKLVLPIAGFVATTYVGNKLISESELVVMQATGFSSFRLARPVVFFGVIVALMMSALVHVLVPLSRATIIEERAALSENITARLLTDGQFTHPGKGITFYIREIDATGQLMDVFLADDRKPGEKTIYTARKTLFVKGESGPKLIMFDGMAQTLDLMTLRLAVTRFADFTYDLGAILTKEVGQARKLSEMTTRELILSGPQVQAESGATRAAVLFEVNNRFADAILSVAVAVVGFACLLLGSYDRLGLWRQIGYAVTALIGIQTVKTFAEQLGPATEGGWALAYLAPVLGLGLALVMLWWSGRPRQVQRLATA